MLSELDEGTTVFIYLPLEADLEKKGQKSESKTMGRTAAHGSSVRFFYQLPAADEF